MYAGLFWQAMFRETGEMSLSTYGSVRMYMWSLNITECVCVCVGVLSRVPQFLPASRGEQHGLDVSHRREVQQHGHVFIPGKLF